MGRNNLSHALRGIYDDKYQSERVGNNDCTARYQQLVIDSDLHQDGNLQDGLETRLANHDNDIGDI